MSKNAISEILVAIDFGEHSAHALEVAIAFATKLDARLTLVHVHYVPAPAYDIEIAWPIEALEADASKALDALVASTKQRYPKCDGVFERGYPSERIVETAKKRGAGLLVIGTHGRRGIPRMLLGSVAEKVVRTSEIPVLTVSAHTAGGTHQTASIRTILCPTDFSECAGAALQLATDLANCLGARLKLVHVFQLPAYMGWYDGVSAGAVSGEFIQALQDRIDGDLKRELQRRRDAGVEAEALQVIGAPFTEIARMSEEVDLIVMGTHGRSGLPHLVLGSVAERVVRMSKCPVITVPIAGKAKN